MRRRTRAITMVVASLAAFTLGFSLLTGCSASTSGDDGTGTRGENATLSSPLEAGETQVVVTDINGNDLTVSTDLNAAEGDSSDGMGGQPGDMGGGQAPGGAGDGGTPPEPPDGGQSGAPGGDGGAPPDAPGGAQATQTAAEVQTDEPASEEQGDGTNDGLTLSVKDEGIITLAFDGGETDATLDDIGIGKVLTLTVADDGTTVTGIVVSNQASEVSVETGSGATTITSDTESDGKTYISTSDDENALRVENAATALVTGATIEKTGDASNSESSSFYGMNSAAYALGGSSLRLVDASISTDASGSNGVFAYGTGSLATVTNTSIETSQGNSGGIMVAGGGTIIANDLTVETAGESSAAIRSDRGGGLEIVEGGTYSTSGNSSPAIYSTANVFVKAAELIAQNSQAVVVEGANSVTLTDCTVTGNVNGSTHRTDTPANVMIYQSMSGDADEGMGVFNMTGGSFNAEHGSLFWITNTTAQINLEDVEISGGYDELLTICGTDEWGTAGSNGGDVTLNAVAQSLAGVITVDEISTLSLSLTEGSSFDGTINSSGAAGSVSVTLDADSTWTLTGDCYITELSGDTSGINLNGHTLYVNGVAWQG